MGIECFDLEVSVIGVRISSHEIDSGAERLRLGLVLLTAEKLAIHAILPCGTRRVCIATHCIPNWWIFNLTNTRVALLSPKELPRRILGVVGRAAILPIMLMVAHQMRRNPVFFQHPGHRIIEWFEWPPRAV